MILKVLFLMQRWVDVVDCFEDLAVLDVQLWSQIVRSECEVDGKVLVAEDSFLFTEDGVCEGWLECCTNDLFSGIYEAPAS